MLTHARSATSISEFADIQQNHVFYMPDTYAHKFLNTLSKKLPQRLSAISVGFLIHLLTQFYQWNLAKKIIQDNKIDLVHEPAPVSAAQPSMMFRLGVPVIIGPMNGGMSFPAGFQHMAGKSERVLYRLVRLLSSFYNLLIPGKFLANILLVANDRTRDALPKLRLGKVINLVENGVFSYLNEPKPILERAFVNVLYAGRLIDLKLIDVAIDAVAKTNQNIKLTIVGNGPLYQNLEQYALTHAEGRVRFVGSIPHAEINQYYDDADIFVLPSVRECGGAVVLEAMARGLPVIAVNWGGPADYITPETGFLVEPKSRSYLVDEFARIIGFLADNPEMRYQLGVAAITRIKQHFLWDKKVEQVITIYKQMLDKSAAENHVG